ncbi:hypothetical protein HQ325_04495 [Rhodococcus sp. BP-349]|uniref:hypothetical protein n=1 Tax=unclassified Rhodococcus (in: high G+C Gram-positive bacteria) TaxID=192944 RepID=UPI001C9B10CE|nr:MULTISPECIES: hypothetical protein [unclassified Rhodococcus (in: high G+C Gram-positive bacteria)]MBY6537925.1 hypothetical protein [Rhodococcus sp. BP-363]MBY6542262.1 hypothetical protein [Rhodococcus sp. BP-369]MBY6561492.1 hypothetical protein [Rhodococcus sp. BP-370]MBY6575784.1 hypothetical protein [Rhodococcus sp. BP-364]MBY6585085.1 hypothetical protein [Rhodococcus sp. BP-358]
MSLTHRPGDTMVHSVVGREKTTSPVDLAVAALPAVAVLCFGVHVALLLVTGTSMLGMVVPMLVLSGLCVVFTCRKGSGTSLRGHLVTAGFGIAMLVVHSVTMHSAPGHSMAGHENSAGMDHAAMGHTAADMAESGNLMATGLVGGPMQAGLVLAVVQVLVAVVAAVRVSRSSR